MGDFSPKLLKKTSQFDISKQLSPKEDAVNKFKPIFEKEGRLSMSPLNGETHRFTKEDKQRDIAFGAYKMSTVDHTFHISDIKIDQTNGPSRNVKKV